MYNGVKVFDVHSHVARPRASNAFLAGLLASNTAMRSPFSQGGNDPATEDDYLAAYAHHVAYMDERNIDVQILGPQPFLTLGYMAPHLIPAWARYVNDCIAKEVKAYPDRFIGACQLPQNAAAEDTTHCLDELQRCVDELGFSGVYVTPDPTGHRDSPGMHEPYWYPLYERCQSLGLSIVVHGSTCGDPRVAILPNNYQIGFVFEQYLATQLLSHSDVFDRFPELKVVICHCGGAFDRFIKTDPHLAQRDLSNNLFFDTCAHDIEFLRLCVLQRTVAQTAFGSEARGQNPGSGKRAPGEPGISGDDIVPVIASFEFLSEDDKVTIFNRNPQKLFPALAKL